MARFAIIDAGRVTNIIEADAEFAASIGAIDATGAAIGDLWDGEAFTPPAPPAPEVPQAVTMRQARLALLGAGLLSSVNTAVASMPGAQGEAARIEWEFSSEVRRTQPLVLAMGPMLGLTDAQLDALFVAAAAL